MEHHRAFGAGTNSGSEAMTPMRRTAHNRRTVDSNDVLDALPIGIVTINGEGLVTYANTAACEILGWPFGELGGRNLHTTIHHHRPDHSSYPQALCPIFETLSDGQTRSIDRETLWRSDGAAVICDLTASPLAGGGLTLSLRDAFARLELARAQDEFVSVVSHELRTPLASLLGALKMANFPGIDTHQRENLIGIARRNSERLARLVDDILDLEKVRNGSITLAREEMTAAALCASAADAVAGTAMMREVRVVVEADDAAVWADRLRIEQVLANLLDNAIKHSPEHGEVTLHARQEHMELAIDVADDGPGIPSEQLRHVFDRFWQADSSDRRMRPGSGLGLTISQAIMELHGGSITVASEAGSGTCFTVHLPVRARDLPVPVDLREDEGTGPHAENPVD